MQTRIRERLTEAQYLALERDSDTKHEFVNGEAWAMAGGSPRHGLLAANIGRAVGRRLARDCSPVSSCVRVHGSRTGFYTYPDVTIVCGAVETHPQDRNTIVNPRAIFEVLSRSTEAYDRTAKFDHYSRITSLDTYVLVAQDRPRVLHFHRAAPDQWLMTEVEGEAGVLRLSAFGIAVPMAEIYHRYRDFPGEDPAEDPGTSPA